MRYHFLVAFEHHMVLHLICPLLCFTRFFQEARELEEASNDDEVERYLGKEVCFGATIQLLHVKSDRFVTIDRKSGASLEKQFLHISLEETGSKSCWFTISPRFKIRGEGQKVFVRDQLILHNAHDNAYLHVSGPAPVDGHREVNGASVLSPAASWRCASALSLSLVSCLLS